MADSQLMSRLASITVSPVSISKAAAIRGLIFVADFHYVVVR